jgi:hypothetical protein
MLPFSRLGHTIEILICLPIELRRLVLDAGIRFRVDRLKASHDFSLGDLKREGKKQQTLVFARMSDLASVLNDNKKGKTDEAPRGSRLSA